MLEDEFGFDLGEVDAKEAMKGGSYVDKPGLYHFIVTGVNPELSEVDPKGNAKAPYWELTCIVSGTTSDQSPVGSVYHHKVYVGPKIKGDADWKGLNRVLKFLVSVGVAEITTDGTNERIIDSETKSTRINAATFRRLKGRHFVANMVPRAPMARVDAAGKAIPPDPNARVFYEIAYGMPSAVEDDKVVKTAPINWDAYNKAKAAGFVMQEFASTHSGFEEDDVPPHLEVPSDF